MFQNRCSKINTLEILEVQVMTGLKTNWYWVSSWQHLWRIWSKHQLQVIKFLDSRAIMLSQWSHEIYFLLKTYFRILGRDFHFIRPLLVPPRHILPLISTLKINCFQVLCSSAGVIWHHRFLHRHWALYWTRLR